MSNNKKYKCLPEEAKLHRTRMSCTKVFYKYCIVNYKPGDNDQLRIRKKGVEWFDTIVKAVHQGVLAKKKMGSGSRRKEMLLVLTEGCMAEKIIEK